MAEGPWPEPDRARIGLCADCLHARRVESQRGSTFCLCGRSADDPTYSRYPPLPVLRCSGYVPRQRIVSLLASGTEIACALGGGDALVGRSHECDNPEWVRELPCCTSPTFDITLSSGEIDREVRRRLKAGEPLYDVDLALVNELRPGLLITQTQCAVCAVTPDDVARAAGSVVVDQVVALSAGSLAGIHEGVRSVGRALGRPEAAKLLIADMERELDWIANRVRDRFAPRVVLLEWTDPLFSTGNWGPELVAAAGGRSLLSEAGQYSAAVSWGQVVEADPDYLVVAPCGVSPRGVTGLVRDARRQARPRRPCGRQPILQSVGHDYSRDCADSCGNPAPGLLRADVARPGVVCVSNAGMTGQFCGLHQLRLDNIVARVCVRSRA